MDFLTNGIVHYFLACVMGMPERVAGGSSKSRLPVFIPVSLPGLRRLRLGFARACLLAEFLGQLGKFLLLRRLRGRGGTASSRRRRRPKSLTEAATLIERCDELIDCLPASGPDFAEHLADFRLVAPAQGRAFAALLAGARLLGGNHILERSSS